MDFIHYFSNKFIESKFLLLLFDSIYNRTTNQLKFLQIFNLLFPTNKKFLYSISSHD